MANVRDSINELISDIRLKRESGQQGKYDEHITALVDDLYGGAMKGFEYDAETDPEYQAAVKDYTTEADRTMRDVLGQGAARTGGIASTAAVAAASQARDYRMGQLAEVKANAYNNAMARNEAETGAKMQLLSALENMEDEDKSDYLQLLSVLEGMDETDRKEARTQIQNMISMGITPGEDLISASGWDKEYIKGLQNYAVDDMGNAQLQQYLNTMGADLGVDGIWGPRSEDAFVNAFGRPSGRQQSATQTYTQGYNPGYTSPVADPNIDSGDFQSGNKNIDKAAYDGLVRTIKTYVNQGNVENAKSVLMANVDKLSDAQYENLKKAIGL